MNKQSFSTNEGKPSSANKKIKEIQVNKQLPQHAEAPMVEESQSTLLTIKKFLKDNANQIQLLATKHHKKFIGKTTLPDELADKYNNYHIKVIEEFVNNIEDIKKGLPVIKKLGEKLAKDSVKDGLTLEDAVDGTIFMKQAVWQMLEKSGLLKELSAQDFYQLSQVIGTYSDVLASKIAFEYHENYVLEQQKLETRKDDFISMASHELKTPVTSLKSYVQVLQKLSEKEKHTTQVQYLSKMDKQINKLTKLISDLLDLSKIEGGRLQLEREAFPIDELVKEVVETVRMTTTNKILLNGQTKKQVVGDRDRLGEVLTNLLTNAIKYSPSGSTIQVTTKANKKEMVISVQDNGIGVAKEHQDRIFDRFYRVEGINEKTYPGFGIGLYFSAEVIKRHGGRIWVESEKGQGSTFSFTLPLSHGKKG